MRHPRGDSPPSAARPRTGASISFALTGERALRPGVLLRKSSLGRQSERGSWYVERMQTVATTLKRAGRSVSEYVIDVSHSVLQGATAPALLP